MRLGMSLVRANARRRRASSTTRDPMIGGRTGIRHGAGATPGLYL